MALVALTLADTIKHVSDLDPSKKTVQVPVDPNDPAKGVKDEEEIDWQTATVFHLKPLDVFLQAHIYDNASTLSNRQGDDVVGIQTKVNQTNIDAVRHGLAGFENYTDKRGNAVKFATSKAIVNGREYDVVADEVLKTFGIKLIQELAAKIKANSEVTADEEKNSAEASPQSA